MPRLTHRERLARVARPLEPARFPYHVPIELTAPGPHPAPGWYWVAAGDKTPSYIASTAARAEVTLQDLARKAHRRTAA